MRDIPLKVLLSFPPANYNNPATRGPALIIINAILIAIVVFIVLLRLYTRLFIKRWIGSDDIFIIIATIFTIGLTTAVILANVKYMWDRHIWDIPFNQIPSLGKIAMAAKLLFTVATFFTRCSLLCFYYRLVHDSGLKKFKWAIHASMAFNVAVCIAFIVLSIFQCNPISAYWTFSFVPLNQCMDEGKVTLGAGILNCILDLLITTLPIPMVMRLQMRRRQQMGVVFLLSLGFIVTIAGIVRTYYIWKSLVLSYDETWFAYPLWICAAVEVDLAVLCACAPALRPFLVIYLRPLITSITGSRNQSGFGVNPNSKKVGYTSTPSGGNSQPWSSLDEEKKAGVYISRNQIPTPKRALSRADRYHQEKQPERLAILRRQSFEISHQDRKGLVDDEANFSLARSTPTGDYYKGMDKWRPRDRPEFTPDIPSYSSPATAFSGHPTSPLSATDIGFAEDGDVPNVGQKRRSIVGSPSSLHTGDHDMYSFWHSDNSTNSQESSPNRQIARVTPEVLADGTRRWDIGYNNTTRPSDERPLRWGKETERGIEMKGIPRTR